MHIHFVCTGNVYRSRLAEAYCRSITQGKELTLSSSGTNAAADKLANGPISWYGMRLMTRNKLIPHMAWQQTQTTAEGLRNVDLLICMRQPHLDYCQNELGYTGTFELWDIPDLNEMERFISGKAPGIEIDVNRIQLSEQTYQEIVQKVDELVAKL